MLSGSKPPRVTLTEAQLALQVVTSLGFLFLLENLLAISWKF